MEVDWNCKEIKVTMGDTKFSVYPEFGCPKTRLVQGITSRFGGLAWISAEPEGSKISIPVPDSSSCTLAGDGSSEGKCSYVADFVSAALECDIPVFVSGTVGDRIALSLEFVSNSANSVSDNERITCSASSNGEYTAPRSEF